MREHGYERSLEIFSQEEMREVLKNPGYLPSREEISYAFTGDRKKIDEWSADGHKEIVFDEKKWDEEFNDRVAFLQYCDNIENPIYELFNEEYLNDLCGYLVERINNLQIGTEPVMILEIGAGSGRLTHFLKQKLEEKVPGKFNIVATDSGKWRIKQTFPVEQIEHDAALKKYQPRIAIFSWMPYEEDYTAEFRSTDTIEEYLLIGEQDCCGDHDLSWRNRYETTSEHDPSIKNIFNKTPLPEISKNQLCRSDAPGKFQGHSRTISFRREQIVATSVAAKKQKNAVKTSHSQPTASF